VFGAVTDEERQAKPNDPLIKAIDRMAARSKE
jgi:hypothetical protein